MADVPKEVRRKLVEFDLETWQAIDLLARDSSSTFQELADEAFRDLLRKHDRPTDLKAALRQSARNSEAQVTNLAQARRDRRRTPSRPRLVPDAD
jgi:hypothetical protein